MAKTVALSLIVLCASDAFAPPDRAPGAVARTAPFALGPPSTAKPLPHRQVVSVSLAGSENSNVDDEAARVAGAHGAAATAPPPSKGVDVTAEASSTAKKLREQEDLLARQTDQLKRQAEELQERSRLEDRAENLSQQLKQIEEERSQSLKREEDLLSELAELRSRSSEVAKRAKAAEDNVSSLLAKVEAAEKELISFESRRNDDAAKFRNEENGLLLKIRAALTRADEAEKRESRLAKERDDTEARRSMLEKELEELTASLNNATDALEQELEVTAALREELYATQDRLEEEQTNARKKLDSFGRALDEERNRASRAEKRVDLLEARSAEEKAKIKELQGELESEKAEAMDERNRLQAEIDEGVRIRQLKARQMNDRYQSIRDEMNSLLEATRRAARKDQERMEKRLREKREVIGRLEGEAEVMRNELDGRNKEVASLTSKLQLEKAASRQARGERESALAEVTRLQYKVSSLNDELDRRDCVIDRYESSFRELLGGGARLAGSRAQKLRRRVANVGRKVTNKPIKEIDE